jgi:hypothetical protein
MLSLTGIPHLLSVTDGPITFLGRGWVLLFGEELQFWDRGRVPEYMRATP